ncbi:lysylphosphatidylglycerol synthase transmembrane domain-containing protein [Pontibacter sp. G13]|uniref:lysylphosphatidylglycerol synthase transmembrane domain-containing protein n=1 Tax=Pontibacter sp. G13 TaxID=3074898 RepID=UPI00288A36DA|nr:lysylphosphatidylglycerol synthase transmembrane domain-containing protein [Pontibacter sp. G13]WNJ16284.1 lysylphosphatidylglycerol synthase transmembrane domain-containing protein [Pontibacter sp. G13]
MSAKSSIKAVLQHPIAKLFLKLGLTGIALWIVWTNIDLKQTWEVVQELDFWTILVALLFFQGSKIIASLRLNRYMRTMGIFLSEWDHLKLYYLGMFYNLILPGGIGGDGYKVILLQKRSEAKTKRLIQAMVHDRLMGVSGLGMLAGVLAGLLFWQFGKPLEAGLGIAASLAIPIGAWVISRWMFKPFVSLIPISLFYSFGVQLCQLVLGWIMLRGMGVEDHIPVYLCVFLVSSIAAALPLSIGGVGARELVFFYAASIVPISKEPGVAFSLMFFLISAVSSLAGVLVQTDRLEIVPMSDASKKSPADPTGSAGD